MFRVRQTDGWTDRQADRQTVLTTVWCGGSSRVAPVTPDSSLPGAINAHRVAPHLDEVDRPRTESRQPAGGLVPDVIHHLRDRRDRGRASKSSLIAPGFSGFQRSCVCEVGVLECGPPSTCCCPPVCSVSDIWPGTGCPPGRGGWSSGRSAGHLSRPRGSRARQWEGLW